MLSLTFKPATGGAVPFRIEDPSRVSPDGEFMSRVWIGEGSHDIIGVGALDSLSNAVAFLRSFLEGQGHDILGLDWA